MKKITIACIAAAIVAATLGSAGAAVLLLALGAGNEFAARYLDVGNHA